MTNRRRERRAHARVDLGTGAVVFGADDFRGNYMVQNLCAKGALLTGSMRGNVALTRGEQVNLLLQLPDGPSIELEAKVVRCAATTDQLMALAVEFETVSPSVEDAIHEALLGAIDPGHRPSRPDLFDDQVEEAVVAEVTAHA